MNKLERKILNACIKYVESEKSALRIEIDYISSEFLYLNIHGKDSKERYAKQIGFIKFYNGKLQDIIGIDNFARYIHKELLV